MLERGPCFANLLAMEYGMEPLISRAQRMHSRVFASADETSLKDIRSFYEIRQGV